MMVEFSMDYVNGRVHALHRERDAIRLASLVATKPARRRSLAGDLLFAMGQKLVVYGTELRQRYVELPADAFPGARLEPTTDCETGS